MIRIGAFRLLCRDVAASAAFYAAAFDAAPGPDKGEVRPLALGLGRVELAPASGRGPLAPSNATAFQHLAIIVADMAAAMARLAAVPGWQPISRAGPERLPAASGGVTAFKFRDPEGHPLEFLAFPAGAAPPVWRDRAGLFLGIDHSAIAVADVEASTAFYGGLGFAVATRQTNRGVEQARMDGVDRAVVDVVGLASPGGSPPRLKLLGYREPAPIPVAIEDGDVLATRIVLEGAPPGLGPLVRDPDGHRLLVAG